MKIRFRLSGIFLLLCLQTHMAASDPVSDTLGQTGIGAVIDSNGASIDVDVLSPLENSTNDGPLDFSTILQLTETLGLTPDSPLFEALREGSGPDAPIILPGIEVGGSIDPTSPSVDLSGAITLPGLEERTVDASANDSGDDSNIADEPADEAACEGLTCDEASGEPEVEVTRSTDNDTSCAEGDNDSDGICNDSDQCLNTPEGAAVFPTGCHLDIDNPLILRGVNFAFNSTELIEESLPYLQRAREIIAEYPQTLIAVDGHTDSKGSESYNRKLSFDRASVIVDYFIEHGIAPERLVARGFGESKPVAPNTLPSGEDDLDGRAQNRRVELTVVDRVVFERIYADNAAREQAEHDAALAAAAAEKRRLERQRAEEVKAEERRRKAEAAREDYEEVLDFLEETGAAERQPNSDAIETLSVDEEDSTQ